MNANDGVRKESRRVNQLCIVDLLAVYKMMNEKNVSCVLVY